MHELPRRERRVYVLGRGATLDVEAVARKVIGEGSELVLLSLGYPSDSAQAGVVGDALRLADELRLWLDAVLVSNPAQLPQFIDDGDEVNVLAMGRERRRIERILGPRIHRFERFSVSSPEALSRPVAAVAASNNGPAMKTRTRPSALIGTTVSSDASANGMVSQQTDPMPEAGPDGDQHENGLAASESVEALAGREIAEPSVGTVWTKEDALARKQAPLRIYLGAAPGVGKTYAMLGEGQRRKSRGTDVAVGFVESHGRPQTAAMLGDLEIVLRRRIEYRGAVFEEMDVDAILARAPEVALFDE